MCLPRIHYVEALTVSVAIFADGASKGVMKVKGGHNECGPDPIGLVSLLEKTPEAHALSHSLLPSSCTEERSCEPIVRRQPSETPGENPHQTAALLTPWS